MNNDASKTNEAKAVDSHKNEPRERIAHCITYSVVFVTIVIALITIINPWVRGEPIDLDFIGKSLLPLWGTWIGTVLAFYFGKVNFDAATQSYKDVIKSLTPDEKIAQLSVSEVMIPFEQIEYLDYNDAMNKTLKEILNDSKFVKYGRYAILDKDRIFKYIIHKSTFHQYIMENLSKNFQYNVIMDKPLKEVIDELLNGVQRNFVLKGANFVSIKENLLEAKNAINAISECQDVFVTLTGKSIEPVLGLITNNMILEKSK